ncbi:MAG: hypothetical protein KOO60_08980 [Gemmatimonadales bacterium]|nr:hypothetical protein [Gemmatimonadales bacterium]
MRKPWNLSAILATCCFALISCSDSSDQPNTTVPPVVDSDGILADHSSTAEFLTIPDDFLVSAAADLNIFYGHTSHGSQLMTGLGMVQSENAKYDPPHIQERSADLGHNGSLGWEEITRAFLADNADDYNVVMWSWCGGC